MLGGSGRTAGLSCVVYERREDEVLLLHIPLTDKAISSFLKRQTDHFITQTAEKASSAKCYLPILTESLS